MEPRAPTTVLPMKKILILLSLVGLLAFAAKKIKS